jgi:predicted dinucleotide-utilizing enzyme
VTRRRIGIIGYGKLGQHLCRAILEQPDVAAELELAFVWDKRGDAIGDEIPAGARIDGLHQFEERSVDLVVEVAHPAITWEFGTRFLAACDYLAGSPTAFARDGVEAELRAAAARSGDHGLYIPRGALPGLEEVQRMVALGKLAEARITMRKHPRSLKYRGELDPPLEETTAEREIYSGPLRRLCSLAPNNVNTMAVLAMASELGFDRVHARLVADPSLEHHITEVELLGPAGGGPRYSLLLRRSAPAGAGAVTSTATLDTFLESMRRARGAGSGVHLR